ncbi:MAG: TonB-dependent receptor domain-containing protein, partial [Flavobacteriales bacterium]
NSRNQFGRIPRDELDPNYRFHTRTTGYQQRSINSAQVSGEHYFKNFHKLKADWISSYTLSTQRQPDLRFFSNTYILPDTPEEDTSYSIRPAEYTVPSRFFRNMKEHNIDNKIHFELPLNTKAGKSKIKFGASGLYKFRDFNESRYDFRSQSISYNGNVKDYLKDENMNAGSPNGYIFISDATEEKNNYVGKQTILGSYGMLDLFITEKIRLITGARIEHTNISSQSNEENLKKGELVNTDILPSVNTVYSINDMMKLRGSYSRTLARPSFRELAPFGSFNFIGDFVLVGNPELNRTLIDNYDIRWEFYPSYSELISVSAFMKDFHDPIERVFNPVATNPEMNYRNVDNAFLKGIELEVRKTLGFLGYNFKNFSIIANVSFIDSKVNIAEDELKAIRALNPNKSSTRQMFG